MPRNLTQVIKPKGLKKGDCIGILSPASPPNSQKLKQGIRFLENRGFRIKMFAPFKRTGYFSGTDEERSEQINKAFLDDEVDAIICSRGGYGSMRILDKIDYKNIIKNPKLLIGFSDITALHLAIYNKCRLTSVHGPMVSFGFNEKRETKTIDSFHKAVSNQVNRPLSYPADNNKWKTMRHGKTMGILIGGNLTLISMLIGTEYLPDFKDKILFIEDLDERPYKIDRLLTHLKLAGKLDNLRSIIIGEMVNCANPKGGERSFKLQQVFEDCFSKYNFPVIYNFPSGHGRRNLTLPFGVKVEIDTRKGLFRYKEKAIS
ncbi:MAG: LD-carboxypeptidase [candidate division Zixibacteria bacterium]|nr:LD-carboxypeptidase [candidate division Zixibacteria bacterium]